MDRRTFLGTVTAATVVASRLTFAATHKIDKIGVQLYTVRDAMQQDFDGTIAKVAAIGYKEVEFAGYFDHSPKDIRAVLDRNGLTAPSAHVPYKSLDPENWQKVLDDGKVVGHQYIVNPWVEEEFRKDLDSWKRVAEKFNQAGATSKKAGIQFAYHNHWFEFAPVNGQLPYDVLLKETDPNLVKMELDLCWITVGGQDPLKYFTTYPGRFPLVHVKDVKTMPKAPVSGGQDYGDSVDMTAVGSGTIDWKRIFAQADKAGIKHYFVEHDKPTDPFESIRSSYEYLQKLKF